MRCEIVFLVVLSFICSKVSSSPMHFDVEDTKNSFYWRRSESHISSSNKNVKKEESNEEEPSNDDENRMAQNDGEKCVPFRTFAVDCNRCICSADGVPYCTKMACVDMMNLTRNLKKEITRDSVSTANYNFRDQNQIPHY